METDPRDISLKKTLWRRLVWRTYMRTRWWWLFLVLAGWAYETAEAR